MEFKIGMRSEEIDTKPGESTNNSDKIPLTNTEKNSAEKLSEIISDLLRSSTKNFVQFKNAEAINELTKAKEINTALETLDTNMANKFKKIIDELEERTKNE